MSTSSDELPQAARVRRRTGFVADGELYEDQYCQLRRWAYTSLDKYRQQLLSVMWPVFVHSFLGLVRSGLGSHAGQFMSRHKQEYEAAYGGAGGDLSLLMQLTDQSQLPPPWGHGRADFAKACLTHKMTVCLSPTALELLLTFLDEHHMHLVLHILNQHVHVDMDEVDMQTRLGKSATCGSVLCHQHVRSVPGSGQPQYMEAGSINKRKINWGLLRDQDYISGDALRAAEREYERKKQAYRARALEEGQDMDTWVHTGPDAKRVLSTVRAAHVMGFVSRLRLMFGCCSGSRANEFQFGPVGS